jgi:hypothetical protein
MGKNKIRVKNKNFQRAGRGWFSPANDMQTSLRRKIKSLSLEISSAIVVLFSSDSTLFWLFPEGEKNGIN